jgi:Flp pilus assembly protein TadD
VQEGLALIQAGDMAGAEASLRGVTEREPQNGRAWSLLGYAPRQLQRLDEAAQAFGRAAELTPEDGRVLMNGGMTFAQMGDVDRAFEWLMKSTSLPTDPVTFPGVATFLGWSPCSRVGGPAGGLGARSRLPRCGKVGGTES